MDSRKTTNIILIFIAIGIWVVAVQSFLITPVRVIGGSIDIDSDVFVKGEVEVNNTVPVSIEEVLGRDGKYYYFNNR